MPRVQVSLVGVSSAELASAVAAVGAWVVEGALVGLGQGMFLDVAGQVPSDAEAGVAVVADEGVILGASEGVIDHFRLVLGLLGEIVDDGRGVELALGGGGGKSEGDGGLARGGAGFRGGGGERGVDGPHLRGEEAGRRRPASGPLLGRGGGARAADNDVAREPVELQPELREVLEGNRYHGRHLDNWVCRQDVACVLLRSCLAIS